MVCSRCRRASIARAIAGRCRSSSPEATDSSSERFGLTGEPSNGSPPRAGGSAARRGRWPRRAVLLMGEGSLLARTVDGSRHAVPQVPRSEAACRPDRRSRGSPRSSRGPSNPAAPAPPVSACSALRDTPANAVEAARLQVPKKIVPQLFPKTHLAGSVAGEKTAHLQGFPSIGETGFEPATARPPVRGLGLRSVDHARVRWVYGC